MHLQTGGVLQAQQHIKFFQNLNWQEKVCCNALASESLVISSGINIVLSQLRYFGIGMTCLQVSYMADKLVAGSGILANPLLKKTLSGWCVIILIMIIDRCIDYKS